MKMRNIAIIAHVDHGKTTLVNSLLSYCGYFRANQEVKDRALDSNDLEREKGITILAKATSIIYKDVKINIVDTPGHADFGGEVERIMAMVDGCLLLVDAFEGSMPQTRFVLKNALEHHIKPIVVINKIDRENADSSKAVDEVLDLFIELGADESLLDFKVVYASALNNTSSLSPDPNSQVHGMEALLDTIIEEIPEPICDPNGHLCFQPALLDYNDFVGRIGIGTLRGGTLKAGEIVLDNRLDGSTRQFKISKLYTFEGLTRKEVNKVHAGDICALAGLDDLNVGETVSEISFPMALPPLRIDEPTLQMQMGTNSSPFRGKEGKFLTARLIEERLFREAQKDVSLTYKRVPNFESWIISGRGELHLSILLETMRREGYEMEVARPEVITKEIDGVLCEPYEQLHIETPDEFLGDIMEILGSRMGELLSMEETNGQTKLFYMIPSRGLIGFIGNFLTLTKGYGIINHSFSEYRPIVNKQIAKRPLGVLCSVDQGKATEFSMLKVEMHGTMFISPGEEVYEGMIVGEHRYPNDLVVNVTAAKPMNNIRSSTKEQTQTLKAPKKMSLEATLDYIDDDELVEITPSAYRMRKKILYTPDRKKFDAHRKAALEESSK